MQDLAGSSGKPRVRQDAAHMSNGSRTSPGAPGRMASVVTLSHKPSGRRLIPMATQISKQDLWFLCWQNTGAPISQGVPSSCMPTCLGQCHAIPSRVPWPAGLAWAPFSSSGSAILRPPLPTLFSLRTTRALRELQADSWGLLSSINV